MFPCKVSLKYIDNEDIAIRLFNKYLLYSLVNHDLTESLFTKDIL